MLHFCECGHLGRKGIDEPFNIGIPGGDETHGVTDGFDVIFEVCESPHEWYQHISKLFGLCIVCSMTDSVEIRAGTIRRTKMKWLVREILARLIHRQHTP